jgi:glucans biosynthesis protein
MARTLSNRPYRKAAVRLGSVLDGIGYDLSQSIHFKPTDALWATIGWPFSVRFFHLDRYAKLPVRVYTVRDGQARQVLYSKELFDYGDASLEEQMPGDLGFAGFRVMNRDPRRGDWLEFKGASYFRSAGMFNQYGTSARGVTIDTGMPKPEEFPRFTAFWLERPRAGSDRLIVYALLDGPSVSGAYRFDCRKDRSVIMEITAHLYVRKSIQRMGIAPLTSMFWYGENNRRIARDWRPEIHDSDGLAFWTGAGERLWRPLIDPPTPQTSSFIDHSPKGFGLLQRDRNFDHYQDDSAFYGRRPSVWVEPREPWGAGAVQLVELPTNDEIQDNIVAYWMPRAQVTAGSQWSFTYRLYWTGEEPFTPEVGRVRATRLGRGGVAGQQQPRNSNSRKFVIDFSGGPLETLERRFDVKAVVTPTRGDVSNSYVIRVVGTRIWRAFFDLTVEGKEPVDVRCFLALGHDALTETWLYRYLPFTYD